MREEKKRPFAEPELERVAYEGDALTASDEPGEGWGQIFPIG